MIEMLNIFLDKGLQKIEAKKAVINSIANKPSVILTDLFDPTLECPEKEFPFLLLQDHGIQVVGATIQYEEFQKFLAHKLDEYFRTVDKQVSVMIDKDAKYPTEFVLSYKIANEQYSLFAFNIYKHTVKDVHGIYELELSECVSQLKKSEYHIQCIKDKLNELKIKEDVFNSKNKSLGTKIKTILRVSSSAAFINNKRKIFELELQSHNSTLAYCDKRIKDITENREMLEGKAQTFLNKFIKEFGYLHIL